MQHTKRVVRRTKVYLICGLTITTSIVIKYEIGVAKENHEISLLGLLVWLLVDGSAFLVL